MLRKTIAGILAAVLLALAMTGCGGEAARSETPPEYYRYVETKAAASAAEALAERFGAAEDGSRHLELDAALELYEPTVALLRRWTAEDFSWLETAALRAEAEFTAEGAALGGTVACNGGEGTALSDFLNAGEMARTEALVSALPDAAELQSLLGRCGEAALAHVEDVTLASGAAYTTLAVALTEEQLRDAVSDVCAVLREDAALERFLEALGDAMGEAVYENFLNLLAYLPDAAAPGGLTMTLHVDADGTLREREITCGDTTLRSTAPKDGGARLTLACRPDCAFYKSLGVYNLTAPTLEGFAYVLEADATDALLRVADADGAPVLTLRWKIS